MKKLFIISVLIGLASTAWAQNTKEEIFENLDRAGAVYYAYPVHEPQQVTAPPKGYEPFYVSHYGRHGSRYLIGDNDYKRMLDLMQQAHDAGVLTPLGEDVLLRIKKVWEVSEGHGGDLSALGARQAHDIGDRLYKAYPQIFKNGGKVTARSTVSLRCSLTMSAFCEALKENNPLLQVTRESSNKHMCYLNYHSQESCDFNDRGPWREEYRKFEQAHVKGERLTSTLFSSDDYILKNINPTELAWGFYWLAVDMQDTETGVSFYDLFTKQELFDIYQVFNYRFYVQDSNYAEGRGMAFQNIHPLLRNIIESAEAAIAGKGDVATLRFGHDGNLIPLTGVLGLKDCYNSVSNPYEFYKAFATWKIAPMAGNVQIIFFRNKKNDDILVKFLHNEQETSVPAIKTDIAPFYHWSDVKNYYETQVLK